MKILADGSKVSSRSYYFLLDYSNSTDYQMMSAMFNKNRLCDLTALEYHAYWREATKFECIELLAKPESK